MGKSHKYKTLKIITKPNYNTKAIMSVLIPVDIDPGILSEYSEEFEWAREELENFFVALEKLPGSLDLLPLIKDHLSNLQISAFKVGLIPLSEILNDTNKIITLLTEIQDYPPLLSEFLLLVTDRISLLIQDVENNLTIDIDKTQSMLIAVQKILTPESSSLVESITSAIAMITREINNNLDLPKQESVVILFDDIELFDNDVPKQETANPAIPMSEEKLIVKMPKPTNNPLMEARHLIQEFRSEEKSLTLLSTISDLTDIHIESHTYFLLELAFAVNILANNRIDQNTLFTSICLHDVPLASIPHIINKQEKLTDEEFELVKLHPKQAMALASDFGVSKDSQLIIHQHHERLDGRGYPLGIKGDDIVEGSRLLAIIDSFHAMTQYRPYKRITRTYLRAISEINACAETKYDKEWVRYFNLCIRDYWLTEHKNNGQSNTMFAIK